MDDIKILLDEKHIPRKWYNIQPDLIKPMAPPLNPKTNQPAKPEDLLPIFPMSLIEQEMSLDRWIDIPEEIIEAYKIWRPTPLRRAVRLEKALKTPARIYIKDESVSPAGSHKANSSVAQAYYNKKEGVKRLTTETGAGQWGSALSFAGSLFDLDITVYMVKVSYEQKPYRKLMMRTWGGEAIASPSNKTEAGRAMLAKDPNCSGSLGMAISEAVEDAASHEDTKYTLGSVLNHVLLHQTVVGLELKEQLKMIDEKPNVIIGCVGGGSNFAGGFFPFVPDKLKGDDIEFIGVEPTSCPTLTKGLYRYDYGDTVGLTPLLKMYTLGHNFMPAPIHAGGLRYHGAAPLLCNLVDSKIVTPKSYHQNEVFEAAITYARTEGYICAPETSHGIKGVIDEALKCKATGEEKAIVLIYSGHGHFDFASYEKYLDGQLEDYAYPDELIKKCLDDLPEIE